MRAADRALAVAAAAAVAPGTDTASIATSNAETIATTDLDPRPAMPSNGTRPFRSGRGTTTAPAPALLIFTGIGALLSERWKQQPRRVLPWLLVAIVVLTVFDEWGLPPLATAAA